MRALKISGIVLGCLIAAFFLLLLGVRLFVNPNDYKGRIEQDVKASTGRELVLAGPLRLSVFPWVALQLGPATLGNPPGFRTGPFASLQYASLRVKLLPLLHRQLEIGRVEIKGLDLQLVRNARGEGNWQFTTGTAPGAGNGTAPGAATPRAQPSGSSGAELSDVAGVTIKDSRVSYQGVAIEDFAADVGRFHSAVWVPVNVKLRLLTHAGAEPIEMSARLSLMRSTSGEQYRIEDLRLEGTWIPQPGKAAVPWDLTAPALNVDLAAQTASAPSFAAQLADAHLTGNLAGTHVLDAPNVTFALALDRLDADRYLSAAPTPARAPAPQSVQSTPSELAASSPEKLRVSGTATIGQATIERLKVSQVRLRIDGNDGVWHIDPASAQLYGGAYLGHLTLDDRGSVPAFTLNQSLTGVNVAQLLEDFDHLNRISGRGNVTTDLAGRGLTSDAVVRTLSGHVTANLTNGAVEGLDLPYQINRAVALVSRRSSPSGKDSGRTTFSAFKAAANLENGIATTRDLEIASQDLRITGEGTVNLVTDAIDYHVRAALLNGTSGGMLADVPFTVSGTLASPSVRPDLAELARAGVQEALKGHKKQLQQSLQSKLKGLLR